MLRIVLKDNLEVLRTLEAGSIDLIYIDPPFNTGREQKRVALRTVRDSAATGPASRASATARRRSAPPATPTASTTTWPSSSRA